MQKKRLAKIIPQSILNQILLNLPFLYRTNFINYESYLSVTDGSIDDLLQKLIQTVEVEGDVIECGCARCGTSIIIAKFLESRGVDKRVYALDSFGRGFDRSELEKERQSGLTGASDKAFTYNSYQYVLKKVKKLGYEERIVPLKGLFHETMPRINSKFCLAFIDCDLSDSIEFSAETVWPSMSTNGIVLFDDYGFDNFKGVRGTVDNFIQRHKDEICDYGLLNRLFFAQKG